MTNDTKISYRENNSTTFLIKFFFQQRLRQCIQRFGELGDHIVIIIHFSGQVSVRYLVTGLIFYFI